MVRLAKLRYLSVSATFLGIVKCANSILVDTIFQPIKLFVTSIPHTIFPPHNFSICFYNSARWIGNHGFSIGIDDVQPDKELNARKSETILNGCSSCDEKIELYSKGKLQLQPGCDAAQTLEAVITDILNQIREETGKVCVFICIFRFSFLGNNSY